MIKYKIDKHAEALTERIIELRLLDVDKIKLAIDTHIKSALFDCLKIQIPDTEKKLNKIKIKAASIRNNQELVPQLVYYKNKLKEEYKLYSELEQHYKLKHLISWVREKHPGSIEDFYKEFNKICLK